MSDKPETIDDILAEMRKFTNVPYEHLDRGECRLLDKIDDFADRIEVAAKRDEDRRRDEVLSLQRTIVKMQDAIARKADAVNAAAMRAALENAIAVLRDDLPTPRDISRAFGAANAALAAPARNCDVGTMEEQKERFKAFCEGRNCYKCPFYGNSDCPLEWALAPFATAEGGSK